MTVKRIPEGIHSVTPYLSIKGAAEAMDFYKRAFNATELFRLVAPSGEIGHAEIKIGDSPLMLADPYRFRSPEALGGSSVGLHVYVEDVDPLFAQAVAAVLRPRQSDRDGWPLCRNQGTVAWDPAARGQRPQPRHRVDVEAPGSARRAFRDPASGRGDQRDDHREQRHWEAVGGCTVRTRARGLSRWTDYEIERR